MNVLALALGTRGDLELFVMLGRALEARGHRVTLASSGFYAERVHEAGASGVDFVIINPAGYTHTSVALRDALRGVDLPFIEVHLSNVHQRETFRHHSYFSDVAVGSIVGLGPLGYELAYLAALDHLS